MESVSKNMPDLSVPDNACNESRRANTLRAQVEATEVFVRGYMQSRGELTYLQKVMPSESKHAVACVLSTPKTRFGMAFCTSYKGAVKLIQKATVCLEMSTNDNAVIEQLQVMSNSISQIGLTNSDERLRSSMGLLAAFGELEPVICKLIELLSRVSSNGIEQACTCLAQLLSQMVKVMQFFPVMLTSETLATTTKQAEFDFSGVDVSQANNFATGEVRAWCVAVRTALMSLPGWQNRGIKLVKAWLKFYADDLAPKAGALFAKKAFNVHVADLNEIERKVPIIGECCTAVLLAAEGFIGIRVIMIYIYIYRPSCDPSLDRVSVCLNHA